MSEPVTIEIASVEPRAINGKAGDLHVGATVFDTTGRQYKITKVTRYKKGIKTVRSGGWEDVFGLDETITYIPA